jgi:hypothetical protein
MDDNDCNEVKKLKDYTGLTSCNWCGISYKVINRYSPGKTELSEVNLYNIILDYLIYHEFI